MDFLITVWQTLAPNGISPIEAFMVGGLLLYLIVKGIIIIPWIKIGNKNKDVRVLYTESQLNNAIDKAVGAKVKKVHELYEIKKAIINAQMSAADKSLVTIKSMLLNVYKCNHCIDHIDRDTRAYSKILDFTLGMTKNIKLKSYVIQNHFMQKSDAEFTLYKQITSKTLQAYHKMCLDDEYYSEDFKMSREELLKADDEIKHEISDELFRMFREIRDIAVEYDKEIKRIENS